MMLVEVCWSRMRCPWIRLVRIEKPGILNDLYEDVGRVGYTNEVMILEEKGTGKSEVLVATKM
jgi:hypothetical protein